MTVVANLVHTLSLELSLDPGVNLSRLIKWDPGPPFNIKVPSFRYGDFHCREKTVVRLSFLTMGIAMCRKDGPYIERGP